MQNIPQGAFTGACVATEALRWDDREIKKVIEEDVPTNSKPIVVYYYFAFNMNKEYQEITGRAMKKIKKAAPGIKFVDSPEAINRICIQWSPAGINDSSVGMQKGIQILNLGKARKGIALHELLHALGFHHEHQREDRNTYVEVSPKADYNYWRMGTPYGRYDPYSIMHYTCDKNKHMRSRRPGIPHNDKTLSNCDKIALNKLYPPVKGFRGWNPKRGVTGLYYCGKENMRNNNAPWGKVGTDGYCGPNHGPNCHICRQYGGIEIRTNDKGHQSIQGETGLFYCGKKMPIVRGKGKELDYYSCGPHYGPCCDSCARLLEKKFTKHQQRDSFRKVHSIPLPRLHKVKTHDRRLRVIIHNGWRIVTTPGAQMWLMVMNGWLLVVMKGWGLMWRLNVKMIAGVVLVAVRKRRNSV